MNGSNLLTNIQSILQICKIRVSRTDEEIATAIADIESTPILGKLFERIRNGLLSGEIIGTKQEEQDLINALQRIAQGNVAKNTLLPILKEEQRKRAEKPTETAPQQEQEQPELQARLNELKRYTIGELKKAAKNYGIIAQRIPHKQAFYQALQNEANRLIKVFEATKRKNEYGIRIGNKPNTFDSLDKLFQALNKDEDIKALYDKVAKIFKELPIDIIFTDAIGKGPTQGKYSHKGVLTLPGHIVYTEVFPAQETASLILHEMIHAVTVQAMTIAQNEEYFADRGITLTSGMKEAVKILEDIHNRLKHNAIQGEYGATNVKEFVAELSNLKFRAKLKEANLWDKVVSAIKKLFGIDTTNALDGSSRALEYLLDNFDSDVWEKYTALQKSYNSFSPTELMIIGEQGASKPLTKAQKKRQIKNLGGLWIEDTQEFAKFVSAVNTYGVERDGEGITYTDNHFYAYYISIDGEPIPYVDIYLNAAQSQALINEITNDYKGTIRERIEQRLNHRDARARITENQNNVSDGNVNSLQSQRDDDGLGLHILRKGRYFDSPNLYVKGRRIDSAIYNEGILAKTTEQDFDELFRPGDEITMNNVAANLYIESGIYIKELNKLPHLFGSHDGKLNDAQATIENAKKRIEILDEYKAMIVEDMMPNATKPAQEYLQKQVDRINETIDFLNEVIANPEEASHNPKRFTNRFLFRPEEDAVSTADTFATAAEAIAQQLGVEIEIDESIPAKGSYNPRTGRIRINPSRHATAEDVQRTVLHETIGHGGIQAVVGERFNEVCAKAYDMMSDEQRADIRSRHGNLSDEAVGAEYMAEMAEKGKVDITTWEKVKAMVRNMLMSM